MREIETMSEIDYESTQAPGPRLFTGFFALVVAAACIAALAYLLTPHGSASHASSMDPAARPSIAPMSAPARDA
jgi:hypothetical protein